jgi:hypothetical protein
MFRYGFESVAVEELSEIVLRLCMDDEDGGTGQFEDESREMISGMVNALHYRRRVEACLENDEDEGHAVPIEIRPSEYFIARYEELCQKHGITVMDGDAWWEDWWPENCRWHKAELNRLAALKVGETVATQRAWNEAMKQHKETTNAND